MTVCDVKHRNNDAELITHLSQGLLPGKEDVVELFRHVLRERNRNVHVEGLERADRGKGRVLSAAGVTKPWKLEYGFGKSCVDDL